MNKYCKRIRESARRTNTCSHVSGGSGDSKLASEVNSGSSKRCGPFTWCLTGCINDSLMRVKLRTVRASWS